MRRATLLADSMQIPILRRLGAATYALVLVAALPASARQTYRLPPPEVVEILDAAPLPSASVSPDGQWLLLAHHRSMPGIEELARPLQRLAGHLINPDTNGPYDPDYFGVVGYSLVQIANGEERPLGVPELELSQPQWAPDGQHFAFSRSGPKGIELWVADAETGQARVLTAPRLNAARASRFGGAEPCNWMSDSRTLLCHLIPEGRGEPVAEPDVPTTPVIQQTAAASAPVWTFQDLLEEPHDEALYDHYMTSQPVLVNIDSGSHRPLGKPGIYETLKPSPSGDRYLAVRIVKPYSYLVPDERFPKLVEVLDAGGRAQPIASLPINEAGPAHLGWSVPGLRGFSWRQGSPATLVYVEALDGGNPHADAQHRDRLLTLEAPFSGEAVELIRTEWRLRASSYRGVPIVWGAEGGVAIINEFHWPTRRARRWISRAEPAGGQPALLWDLDTDDWYGNPGDPLLKTTERGERVLLRSGDWIFLAGGGGSPEGDRPFLDRFNLRTLQTERLFRSQLGSYESVVAVLDDEGRKILTRYETQSEPSNYFVRDLTENSRRALTAFPHPAPQLAGITKQKVNYMREDGIPLSGELYLPAGYRSGEPLPTVVWAYPTEYASRVGAGQVRGSADRFSWSLRGPSHLLFLTQGYAVLDDASMPIVGGAEANDTYVDQLVASGRAAVELLVEKGVSEHGRIGIAGHSYGAFMTANLLAHSDLFSAGIARSGAYNRSLTPFGFQNEQRTFWQAPQVYFQMSPFMNAHQIDEPMLLIHGMSDSNSGTYPVQSERMYHALKGLGGTARLVMLPHENHGYRGRESVLHTVWEMLGWFDKYVGNREPDARR